MECPYKSNICNIRDCIDTYRSINYLKCLDYQKLNNGLIKLIETNPEHLEELKEAINGEMDLW